MLLRLALIAAALLTGAPAAWAACSSPSGIGGDVVYNVDYAVLQICNGTNWVALGGNGNDGSGETDPQVGTLTEGKWCTASGGAVTCTSDAPLSSVALDDLTDVVAGVPTLGEVLYYNGSQWVNQSTNGLFGMDYLSDTTLTNLASNDLLQYNGTNWVNVSATTLLSSGDRITSSTTAAVIANAGTGYISLTANASTAAWGYLGSSATYLPNLSSNLVSATTLRGNGAAITNISATLVGLNDISASSPNVGDVLQWDPVTSKWTAVSPSDLISNSQVAFSVYKNSDQTVTANSWVKLTWSTEDLDTNSNFTSDRFTPSVPGKYLIQLSATCSNGGGSTGCHVGIYKNGSNQVLSGGLASDMAPTAIAILDMNGTTDYVEGYAYNTNGTVIAGGSYYSRFSGALINAYGSDASAGAVSALNDLTDATITTATSGDLLYYNGSAWVNQASSGLFSADRITSSTTAAIIANSATGYISLTANASTAAWGYLGASATYLPILNVGAISVSTNRTSVTTLYASGKVGIGTTTPEFDLDVQKSSVYAVIASQGDQVPAYLSVRSYGNTPYIQSIRTRGTKTTPLIVQDNDILMALIGHGHDGTTVKDAASIQFSVDGTPGASDMPGKITFWTTPDGSSSLIERMRIDSSGNVGIATATPSTTLTVSGTTSTNAVNLKAITGGAAPSSYLGGFFTTTPTGIYYTGGNVGIGTTNPSSALHVNGGVVLEGYTTFFDQSGNNNEAWIGVTNTGWGSNQYLHIGGNTDGGTRRIGMWANETIISGRLSVNSTSSPDVSLLIGPEDGTNEGGQIALLGAASYPKWDIDVYQDNFRILSNSSSDTPISMYNTGSGNILFSVYGSAYKPGGGSWADSSDIRLKKDIRPITGALDKLTRLNGVEFNWREPTEHETDLTPGGFIAQNVQQVFPEFISKQECKDEECKLVDDGQVLKLGLPFKFDAYVVEAIKELKTQNDRLRQDNAALKSDNADLRTRLQKIEQKLNIAN